MQSEGGKNVFDLSFLKKQLMEHCFEWISCEFYGSVKHKCVRYVNGPFAGCGPLSEQELAILMPAVMTKVQSQLSYFILFCNPYSIFFKLVHCTWNSAKNPTESTKMD